MGNAHISHIALIKVHLETQVEPALKALNWEYRSRLKKSAFVKSASDMCICERNFKSSLTICIVLVRIFVFISHLFTFVIFILYFCEDGIRHMDLLFPLVLLFCTCVRTVFVIRIHVFPLVLLFCIWICIYLCHYSIRHLDSCIRVSSHRDASAGAAHEARCWCWCNHLGSMRKHL